MILLATLLAIAFPTSPHPFTSLPDQHFGRWTLTEAQYEYPPRPAPFGPWTLGGQTLSMQSVDGKIGWKIEASNQGFGTHIRVPPSGKLSFGVSAGPDNFPMIGQEGRFFDEFVNNLALIDMQDFTPADRSRYRIEIQSSRADFITAIQIMREDADVLYGGVHRAPACTPPSCVY